MKRWYTSKTVIANLIGAAVTIATAFGLDLGLTPEAQAELVAGMMVAINIALRFVTKVPIKL